MRLAHEFYLPRLASPFSVGQRDAHAPAANSSRNSYLLSIGNARLPLPAVERRYSAIWARWLATCESQKQCRVRPQCNKRQNMGIQFDETWPGDRALFSSQVLGKIGVCSNSRVASNWHCDCQSHYGAFWLEAMRCARTSEVAHQKEAAYPYKCARESKKTGIRSN